MSTGQFLVIIGMMTSYCGRNDCMNTKVDKFVATVVGAVLILWGFYLLVISPLING